MRASRLLTILILLQRRGRVTAQDLADRFEVSKRTVYRDMDELSAAGVPLYADRGVGGGFALYDDFRTDLTGLTNAEAKALAMAGLPEVALELGFATEASAARFKLLAAVPVEARKDATHIAECFHLDPVDWYQRAGPPAALAKVAAAVWQSRHLHLSYRGWNGTSDKEVAPFGLVLKGGDWYLLAERKGREAIYKVASIEKAEVLDTHFRRPDDFDLRRIWREKVGRFETSLQRLTARIRVSPKALSRLPRLGATAVEAVNAAHPDDDGWREADIPIEGISHAASELLVFTDQIEVLVPQELRDEITRRATAIARLYTS